MIPGGYILLSRQLLKSEVWQKPPFYLKVWLYLLLKASHGRTQEGHRLGRGQCLITIGELQHAASYLKGYALEKLSEYQVRRALGYYRDAGMATTTKTTRALILTICNYDLYQNPGNYEHNGEAGSARRAHDRNDDRNGDRNADARGKPLKSQPLTDAGGTRTQQRTQPRTQRQRNTTGKKEKNDEKKRTPPATQADAHADAFKAAFDGQFDEPYQWQKGDFVQLAQFRKAYPAVTPERFVEVARACWRHGQYTPGNSLTIRGLCSHWPELAAKAQLRASGSQGGNKGRSGYCRAPQGDADQYDKLAKKMGA